MYYNKQEFNDENPYIHNDVDNILDVGDEIEILHTFRLQHPSPTSMKSKYLMP